MRTYAPAETGAVLADLLDEPSIARGVVHHAVLPARPPDFADFPDWLDPRIVAGLAGRGISRPYTHQAEAIEAVHARLGRRRRDPDRVGQVAVLRAADPPGHRRGPGRPGPPPLPDQGARPGPGGRVRRAGGGERPARLGVDLRRRHAGADPLDRPGGRPGRRHQPGHAPLGDPAPPHQVVPAVRAAPVHRHRRAAHVSRRVRQPRRQRPAPAAADLRPLRQPPGDRVLLGDDREPGRARGDADRPAGPARSTGTGRRPASATSSWSTRRSSTRRAAPAARPRRSPSAGRCRSCAPGARRSSSGGRASRSRSC